MERLNIQSPGELLSVALHAAQVASGHYVDCAEQMRGYENDASAAVFDRLAAAEVEREQLIIDWASAEGIALQVIAEPLDWQDLDAHSDYDVAAQDPIRSTPYKVLAFIVHRSEQAFRFFTYVAANARNEATREYAEILAQEELDRASLNRVGRRRAWHIQRKAHPEEAGIYPDAVTSMGDLLAVSASLEHCVHADLSSLLEDYPRLQQLTSHCEDTLADIETRRPGSGTCSDAAAGVVESVAAYREQLPTLYGDRQGLLRRLCTDSDRCFAYYDAVVARTRDEAIMLQAQRFTRLALARLDMLTSIVKRESQGL